MIRDIFNNFNRYGSLYNMLFEDAEIMKEDTWYYLKNGEFVEYE